MLNIKFKNNFIGNKSQKLINEINKLEDNFKNYTDSELRIESLNLRQQYILNQSINSLIVPSFALTREASRRTLGLRHFDVQLVGGIVLNSNKIAEMKTGEGKTLVATLPAILNSINNKGVHIVTVNDYLANRDYVSMGQVYRYLGLTTGLIQQGMSTIDRKNSYKSDITYVTNSELAFDFLRDNSTTDSSTLVLRPFNYGIIDEVDSVLIDEAQTPIILSNKNQNTSVEKFIIASEIINYLELNKHYKVDEKNKNVILTQDGSKRIESILDIEDLYNPKDPWIPYILNALKAQSLFFNNTHYIIQNNRIIIVDEFTGRTMPDRRWGDGLHQAIQAKEKLSISYTTETQASTTYQNLFLLYPKLSGMTGTAKTAEIEFEKIYNLSVEQIPTFQPNQRLDLPDLIYTDQISKWNGVVKFCKQLTLTNQPILIGTTTVEKSEILADLFDEYKLTYKILNAKPENIRKESEIIAQAGMKNSITIATNMAGRGTDIILGGNSDFKIQRELFNILISLKPFKFSLLNKFLQFKILKNFFGSSQRCLDMLLTLSENNNFINLSDIDILRTLRENNRILIPIFDYQCSIRFLIDELTIYDKKHQIQENKIIRNLGGLYVIGTERNDSRRIDNQLRGRCGRQGDPGTSRFFLSLDDNLLKIFGGVNIQKFLAKQNSGSLIDGLPIESSFISKRLDSAQEQVEERSYEQRKNLFEYDKILNEQRNKVYFERRILLESNKNCRKNLFSYGEQIVCGSIYKLINKELNFNQFTSRLENILNRNLVINNFENKISNKFNLSILKKYLFSEFWLTYQLKINEFNIHGPNLFETTERLVTLLIIDRVWQQYLQTMVLLRDAVGWRRYGQQNPLTEYKRESYKLFSRRNELLAYITVYSILRSYIL